MHEASIAAGIVDRLAAHPDLHGRKILAVRMKVGRLTTVVPDNLRFLFGAVAVGTPLEGADLLIEEVPARANCAACGASFGIDGPCFLCPECGGGGISIESGRELTVETVDVE